MDDTTVKMHIFLDLCYEVEHTCAEIYYLFAQLFNEDRKFSRLWYKTAMEEENHARHVLLALKMVKSINWVCLESWHNATTALDLAKQYIGSVRESPPTLRGALLMALDCESRMENLHMQSAILVKEQVGNSMFRALMKDDRDHIEMLQSALEEMQMIHEEELEIVNFEELDPMDIMECQPPATDEAGAIQALDGA